MEKYPPPKHIIPVEHRSHSILEIPAQEKKCLDIRLLRGTIVNKYFEVGPRINTKKTELFLPTIFGPIYDGPHVALHSAYAAIFPTLFASAWATAHVHARMHADQLFFLNLVLNQLLLLIVV